jgi:hypothetical protein
MGLPNGTDQYTIMLYMKRRAVVNNALVQMNPANTDNAELILPSGSSMTIDGTASANVGAHYNIGLENWHQVVMVVDGVAKKIYIDGETETAYSWNSADNTRYLLNQDGLLFFTDSRADFNNDIDVAEIAIWDKPLTTTEIHEASGLRKLDRTTELSPVSYSNATNINRMFDGVATNSNNNSWTALTSNPNYVVIDLGAEKNIGRIVVFGPNAQANTPKTIQALVSNSNLAYDDAGWGTQVGEIVRVNAAGNMLTFDLSGTSAIGQYLQLYFPDRWNTGLVVNEVTVYKKVE